MQFYVSTTGNDSNPGTVEDPWLTISHAQTVVRAAISSGMTENVRVILRGGRYEISAAIEMTSADSGRDGFVITWESYPGETARISGGEIVTGWTLHSGSIHKANVGTDKLHRQLFVNGRHQQRARGPSAPSGWAQTETGYTAPDSSMESWGNIQDIEIVSYGLWIINRCKVDTIVGTAVTMQDPCWSIQKSLGWASSTPGWVENALELLTEAGEWYLDRSAGYLYYWPTSGSMSGLEVIAPKVDKLLTITGAQNLSFHGLVFEHANWTYAESGNGYPGDTNLYYTEPNDPLNIDPDGVRTAPGAIEVVDSQNIRFTQSDFVHLGVSIPILIKGSTNVLVSACLFDENAGGASQVGASYPTLSNVSENVVFDSCVIGSNNCYDYQCNSLIAMVATKRSAIRNCLFLHTDLGWSTINMCGNGPLTIIAQGVSEDNTVKNNRISYSAPPILYDGAPLYFMRGHSPTEEMGNGLHVSGNRVDAAGAHHNVYQDFDSGHVTGTGNLMLGTHPSYSWLHILMPAAHDLTWTGNYTDNATVTNNSTTRITISDNMTVSANNLPAEALKISEQAGVRKNQHVGTVKNRLAPMWPGNANRVRIGGLGDNWAR